MYSIAYMLFNICLDYILNKAIEKKNGIAWNYFQGKRLTDLEYADLVSRSIEDWMGKCYKI